MEPQVLGIVAGVFTSTGMLPQLIKIIKTKEAKDISMFMLVVLFIGFCLWIWYAVEKDDLPVLLTNIVSLILTILTAIFTIKYKKKK